MTERPWALPRYTRPLLAEDPVSVGPYLLLARIAGGATGTVYLSRDSSGAWVAVRALHPAHARRTDVRARFAAAVERAARVQGLGTCAVVDAAPDAAETPYVVFEFVDGPTLAQEVSVRGPLTAGELRRLAVDVAGAVACLHRARVVHGALEPSDVVLSLTGARLVDLGSSRTLASLLPADPGHDVVTAPEVLAGREIGPASDVFGWATLVVFAATGRAPGALPAAGRGATVPGVDDEALGRLVARALADDPAARPTVAEVVAAFAVPRPQARPRTRPRPQPRPQPRPLPAVSAPRPVNPTPDGVALDDQAASRRSRRALVAGAVFLTVAASAAAVAPAVSASGGDTVQSAPEVDTSSDLAVDDVPAPVLASGQDPDSDPPAPASPSPSPEATEDTAAPYDPSIAVVPLAPRDPGDEPPVLADIEPPPAPSEDDLELVAPPVVPVTPTAAPPAVVAPPPPAAPVPAPSPSPSGLTLTQVQVVPLS